MALCGGGRPVTFNIELEHQQLLNRLERLRYVSVGGRFGGAIPRRIREDAVAEIGKDVGRIIGKVQTLLAEEWRAVGSTGFSHSNLIHVRLVLNGSELALIPFEMAIAPAGIPGEGWEWLLQSQMPVVITREIRSSRPDPVSYCRNHPRILLVSAAPGGSDVPLALHVHALRFALEPWICWPKPESDDKKKNLSKAERNRLRLEYVKEHLRVLPAASLEDVYEACSAERFTHIHILAHGDFEVDAGEKRYGVALCRKDDPTKKKVVDGKRLAKALLAESENGSGRSRPLMVFLATCDSGNEGSVLIPGGSIAHDLHTAGIPWVFASQFPLTKPGSVRMAEALYPKLLRGDDPRLALHEVRRQLYMHSESDHDWASLVAYATITPDFDEQVMSFFVQQTMAAIRVHLARADASKDKEMEIALKGAEDLLDTWERRITERDTPEEVGKMRLWRVECYGIRGSTFKRIGLLLHQKACKCKRPAEREELNRKSKDYLEKSLDAYQKAMAQRVWEKGKYHWVATQTLFLIAFLKQSPESEMYQKAMAIAKLDLDVRDEEERAWARGTLAELEMLGMYHDAVNLPENITERVQGHCRAMVKIMGETSFHVRSTKRQFERYVECMADRGDEWKSIAEAAVRTLSPRQIECELAPDQE
jgi:hypothetical protein